MTGGPDFLAYAGAAAIAYVGCLLLMLATIRHKRDAKGVPAPPDSVISAPAGEVRTWMSAGASSEMVPALLPLLANGFVLYIIGFGGRYLALNNAYFATLKDWLTRFECEIHYVIVSPDRRYLARYIDLAELFRGKFFLHCISAADVVDEDLRGQLLGLETFHPVLLTSKVDLSRKAMWLEGHHPRDSAKAYDIEFVDFTEVESPGRSKKFDELLAVVHKVIAAADSLKQQRNQQRHG